MRRVVGADLVPGGAEVLRRVANRPLNYNEHVIIFLADCDRLRSEAEAGEGRYLRVPDGTLIRDFEWPHIPDGDANYRAGLPAVIVWGVGVPRSNAEAACRALVRAAYDCVGLWLGTNAAGGPCIEFEAEACPTE